MSVKTCPVLKPPVRSGQRGRSSFLPGFIQTLENTELGQPIVLKTGPWDGSARPWANQLNDLGYSAFVVSPNTQRAISETTMVRNMSDKYALVAFGVKEEDAHNRHRGFLRSLFDRPKSEIMEMSNNIPVILHEVVIA